MQVRKQQLEQDMEQQTGSKLGTSRLYIEGKRGEQKSWLKIQHSKYEDHSIWSHHFMANRGKKMETVADLIFLGSKITADGDYSNENKRLLFLGMQKGMDTHSSILAWEIPWTEELCGL